MLDFNKGSRLLHTLLQPQDTDSTLFLTTYTETVAKVSEFVLPVHLMFSVSIGRLPRWSKRTKIHHREVILLVLDAPYTDQENGCQAIHEQQTQNVVVLHLARRTGLHN
jgi:hypothetical protein